MTAQILAFAGSARKNSWNKKLVQYAARVAKEQGAIVTVIDLADYPMPIYDGDLEETDGVPETAKALKKLMCDHDGILIASPEYNSEIPPLVKNIVDWVSRPDPGDERRLVAYSGKTAAVLSAAPGALGGTRVRMSLRALFSYLGMIVVPEQYGLSNCTKAFEDDGSLRPDIDQTLLIETIQRLVFLSKR